MATVVISATSASYSIGAKVGKIEARISALEMFANQGDRWTAKEGLENRQMIRDLRNEVAKLPPDWFEKQQDETREEVKTMAGRLARVEQAVHDLMQIIVAHRKESQDARKNR